MWFLDSLVLVYQNGYEKASIDLQLRYIPNFFGSEEEAANFRRDLEDRVSFLRDRRKTFGLFERIAFNLGYRRYMKYVLRELGEQAKGKLTEAFTNQ